MLVRLDGGEASGRDGGACGGCQLAQLEAQDLAQPERLGHRQRPVPEMRLGREQLDLDATLPVCPQRERRLERSHASAGDQDRCRSTLAHDYSPFVVRAIVRPRPGRAIGDFP
jgi:hypothetical protein